MTADFETVPVGTMAKLERMREALEPSGDTKSAYHGEFYFDHVQLDHDGEEGVCKIYVPWTTVKEIMAAIKARAAWEDTK